MIIKLKAEQYSILVELFDIPNDKVSLIINEFNPIEVFNKIKYSTKLFNNINGYFIEAPENIINDIREMCGAYLMFTDSFDTNYNVTERGRVIESLIDLFYLDNK